MELDMILTTIGAAVAIIATNVSLMSWLRSDMKSFETKIENNMRSFEIKIDGDIKALESKLDKNTQAIYDKMKSQAQAFSARTDHLSARADQLYQMFIDLLKSQKPKTDP